jgi:hypothetical protein
MQESSLTHKATSLKWAVYRALCAFDLIDFFKEYDTELLKILKLSSNLASQIRIIKEEKPSIEDLKQYGDDWFDLSLKVINSTIN